MAIRNNGIIMASINTCWYATDKAVLYTQLNIIPFIKVLRRVVYQEGKKTFSRKLLNRLDARGIAIWYMDDGHINIRKNKGKPCGFYIKISTCEPKEQVQTIIDYFEEIWDIHFYMFHEGRQQNSYSICCGTREGLKFISLVKPYVEQVPSMLHKIQYDLTQGI